MSAALTMEHTATKVDVVDDAEFELDLRVVESTTKLDIMLCGTDDGCGSTCEGSACTTFSNDPF